MKSMYVLLVACLVILLGLIGYVKQPVKGDVNCDRRVSITDLVQLHKHVVDDFQMMCPGNGDMNEDFTLDMKDVEQLRRQLSGLE